MTDLPLAAARFTRLLEIMQTLRSPGGCPWDRDQTIDTLKPFVLEETYEVLDAIDRHDHHALREELGDFLLQAIFLAQLEAEAGHFTIADSLDSITEKLVRRHPHVYARTPEDAAIDSAGQVRTRWEEIKAQERGQTDAPKTLLGGIPAALPALLRAHHIGVRAASVGFEWARASDVMDKIQEEVDELREVIDGDGPDAAARRDRAEEEMGDLFFAMANLARKLGIEPETALRKANEKFTARFSAMERAIAASGRTMRDMTIDELEREWQRLKQQSPEP
jgi:MazG family protein